MLTWIVQEHSKALLGLASKVAKCFISYVKVVDNEVLVSKDHAHTPSEQELLYRVHAGYGLELADRLEKVIEQELTLEELKEIKDELLKVKDIVEKERGPLGYVSFCVRPLINAFSSALVAINTKNYTYNLSTPYEEAVEEFKKRLCEVPWNELPKATPIKPLSLSISRAVGRGKFWIPYLKGFSTDFERICLMANYAIEKIDDAYLRYLDALKDYKSSASGFLKRASPEVTQKLLSSMEDFYAMLAGLTFPPSFYDKQFKVPILVKEALGEVDKAIEKASKTGRLSGKDVKNLIDHYIGFRHEGSILRWMNAN